MTMIKLTDTQAILLSSASQRNDGSLLPLPASITPGGGATKAIAALVRSGLANQRETQEAGAIHRKDDVRYGVFITAAGLAAIGISDARGDGDGDGDGDADSDSAADAPFPAVSSVAPASAPPALPRPSKQTAMLALLQREHGATSPELIEATGWLPHTVRAALTGLRKKGHEVTRGKRDGITCYHVASIA
jgi:hypothetical protein